MTRPRHSDTSPGWIRRELKELRRLIRESNAAKRLQAATIGFGGLTVKDGGSIKVLYPDGSTAFTLASKLEGQDVTFLQMLEEDGVKNVLTIYRIAPGANPTYPDGFSTVQCGVDDFLVAARNQLLLGGPDSGLIFTQPGIPLYLSSDNGVGIIHQTTASAANCYIDPVTAVIYREASSLRYKTDVADADLDAEKLLQLRPIRFRDKAQVAELGDDAPVHVGFLAEEAAELGLDYWVTSDDEGPEAFAYARWPVASQAIDRAQQSEIDELKATVADLTQRVDALENGG